MTGAPAGQPVRSHPTRASTRDTPLARSQSRAPASWRRDGLRTRHASDWHLARIAIAAGFRRASQLAEDDTGALFAWKLASLWAATPAASIAAARARLLEERSAYLSSRMRLRHAEARQCIHAATTALRDTQRIERLALRNNRTADASGPRAGP